MIENRSASLSAPLWHTASWLEALKSHLYPYNVEDSPPRLAGEQASYKFHKRYLSIIVTFSSSEDLSRPPSQQGGRSSAAQSLPVSLSSLLWGIKHRRAGKRGALHYWPPDCGHWALSLRWALSLLSAECTLPAPAERPSSPLSPPSSLTPWRSSAERPRPPGNTAEGRKT